MPEAVGAQIELVRRWATMLGNTVESTTMTNALGVSAPGLKIQHGNTGLAAVEVNGVVGVMAMLGIDPALRALVRGLSQEIQERMLSLVRNTLSETPRNGWTLFPTTVSRIGDLEAIQIVQLLRVEETDISSFNRLSDAIQELATATVRVQAVYGTVVPSSAGPKTPSPDKSKTEELGRAYR
jgi:hypothetical protein